MLNIYQHREKIRIAFILVTIILVAMFLYISNTLMRSLEAEERSKMEIWAEATRQLASNDNPDADMSLVLKVIQSNTTIPVIIMDEHHNLLWNANIHIAANDTTSYLNAKANELKQKGNVIEIIISDNIRQYLYYDDSVLLKRLSYFPYIQLIILLLFLLLGFFAFSSTKKAEQNQVWVGLSKETAHQLGTPISSLMAWIEYLRNEELTPEILDDMNKDVVRLDTIAQRFSKIGSQPKLEPSDLNEIVSNAVNYMRKRVSSKIDLITDFPDTSMPINASEPLMNWVIENLCKNAIDAIPGRGVIKFSVFRDGERSVLEVCDNGKGLSKKRFKTIFNPGFTTKKRGWGLGLTLVKRIIEEYHHGRIFVKESVPNQRTVFRVEIKCRDDV